MQIKNSLGRWIYQSGQAFAYTFSFSSPQHNWDVYVDRFHVLQDNVAWYVTSHLHRIPHFEKEVEYWAESYALFKDF